MYDQPAHMWRRKGEPMSYEIVQALDQLKAQVKQTQEGSELLAQALQGFANEVRRRLDALEKPVVEQQKNESGVEL